MNINVNVSNADITVTSESCWQYDVGVKLVISGLTGISMQTPFHFSNQRGGGEALLMLPDSATTSSVTVSVPDALFVNNGRKTDFIIYCYCMTTSTTECAVQKEIRIPVRARSGEAKAYSEDPFISKIEAFLSSSVEDSVDLWLTSHPEATTTVPDGSLTDDKFDSELKLLTIKDYVTPEMYGGSGNDSTDNTQAFNSCIATNKPILVGNGIYRICGDVICKANTRIVGVKATTSKLRVMEAGSITTDSAVATDNSNITFENLYIMSTGDSTTRTKYTIELWNPVSPNFNHCFFSTSAAGFGRTEKHGLRLLRSADNVSYTKVIYLARIERCRFSGWNVYLDMTDNYIVNNEFWGNNQDSALTFKDCSNSIIMGNQFVGGDVYGCIRFTSFAEGVKIVGNYFDGSWAGLETRHGIYIDGEFCGNVINGNNFWQQKSCGIYASGSSTVYSNTISGNAFSDNDMFDRGVGDIEIYGGTAYGNIISDNAFKRTSKYSNGTSKINGRTKRASILKISGSSSNVNNVVSNNVVNSGYYYSNASYSGLVKVDCYHDIFYTNNLKLTYVTNDYISTSGVKVMRQGDGIHVYGRLMLQRWAKGEDTTDNKVTVATLSVKPVDQIVACIAFLRNGTNKFEVSIDSNGNLICDKTYSSAGIMNGYAYIDLFFKNDN